MIRSAQYKREMLLFSSVVDLFSTISLCSTNDDEKSESKVRVATTTLLDRPNIIVAFYSRVPLPLLLLMMENHASTKKRYSS